MKKIIEIFLDDLKRISKSPIAIIIIIGIIFIPGIYAWLNIDSNWNPYDNTGNMPVAVVNKDKGVTILGENINVGEEIEDTLKDNDGMKWVFTTEKDALKKVKTGEYYGAIIIPDNFSDDVKTIFENDKIEKPKIDFYINNKKNPIAPIIVNKAVGTVQSGVNEAFVNEIIYRIFDKAENLNLVGRTDKTADETITKLENSKEKVRQLQNVLSLTSSATNTADNSLSAMRKILPTILDVSDTASKSIDDMKRLSKTFDNISQNIDDLIDTLLDELNNDSDEINDIINSINESNVVEKQEQLSNKIDNTLAILNKLDNLLISINNISSSNSLKSLEEKISKEITALEKIKKIVADKSQLLNNLDELKNEYKKSNTNINSIINQYNKSVKKDIKKLFSDASNKLNNASSSMITINGSINNLDLSLQYLINALNSGVELTYNINDILDGFVTDIDKLIYLVEEAKDNELYKGMVNMLADNPEQVADFISSPIETNRIDYYKIDSYGSEMAPFYSILACWVGGTILISILSIKVLSNKVTRNAKDYEKFFGRFMLFGIIAMLQGFIIGIGDIILQVQTINWFLFLLALMYSSLIFVLIIYSLVVAFGKVGQALTIVIMVLQVAGSGGTFPIELLPRFFQFMQPLMPFYPAMSAVRETVGGFYGLTYLKDILLLSCHIIIPLLLGLVFNKYAKNIKSKLGKQLSRTELIE